MAGIDTLPNVSDDDQKALADTRAAIAAGQIPSVAPSRNAQLAADSRFIAAVNQVEPSRPRSAPPTTTGIPAVGAAPDISVAPDMSALSGGIPSVMRPTPRQSIAAGMAEHGTNARQEGKSEFEQMKPATPEELGLTPFSTQYNEQNRRISDFEKAHPYGADISAKPGFWGKLEHGLAKVGNIAGTALIPEVMANTPGTELYRQGQRHAQQLGENMAVENEERAAQAKNLAAETAKTNAGLGGWEPLGEPKQDDKGNWFQAAKDASGNVKFEPVAGGPASPNLSGKTPAEQTYDSLLKQTNPTTGKPYTAQEALAEVTKAPPSNETAEDSRFEKILSDQKLGKPVSPEDQAWADAYKQRKALGPQAAAAAGAQNATLTPLINPTTGEMMGTFNTKTGEMTPIKKPMTGATTAAGAGVGNKQAETFNKDYVNPAESIERSYQMFEDAYKAIQSGDAKTGAEDMLLLSQHLGTTFGQVKGSRMNKDLIEEHKDAIGIQDKIERYGNNIASGQMLSPDQRKEFGDLISNMRNLTWRIATKEAARNNQPINFLPADVQITMRDARGVSRPVPGDRVQEYLNKGAQLAN